MSTLRYNNVELKVVQTASYTRQDYYHGPTYLFTRHRAHVRCLYSPGSTSYTLPAGANPLTAPLPGALVTGTIAPTTDSAIRHALMQPRKRLLYATASTAAAAPTSSIIIDVPVQNLRGRTFAFATDVANGPTPIACNVRRIDGTNTFRVEYIIQADLNECYLFYSKPATILSHRWKASETVSVDALAIRTFNGEVIFRRDGLAQRARLADDFWNVIGHPLPQGFRRELAQREVQQDGLRLTYTIRDVEKPTNIHKTFKNLTRVAGKISVGVHTRPIQEAFAEGTRGSVRWIKKTFATDKWSDVSFDLPQSIGNAVEIGADIIGGTLTLGADARDFLAKFAPTQRFSISLQLWGDRNSTTAQLIGFGRAIILAKMASVRLATLFFDMTWNITTDVVGRFVSMEVVGRMPFDGQAVAGTFDLSVIIGFDNIFNNFKSFLDESIGGGILFPNAIQEHGLYGEGNPTPTGGRATSKLALRTQDLTDDCEPPNLPPATEIPTSTTETDINPA